MSTIWLCFCQSLKASEWYPYPSLPRVINSLRYCLLTSFLCCRPDYLGSIIPETRDCNRTKITARLGMARSTAKSLTSPLNDRSLNLQLTRKPSYRWQTRATRKPAKNCSNSTCLQRCRWQYWPIFMRLAVVASEICEIPRNSLKIQTYEVQGHPRSSILVPIESPYVTCY